MTRHVRRVERVETSVSSRAVRQARHSRNAWFDTSNVLSRVETLRDEPSGIRAYPSSTLWIASLYTRCSNAVELSIKPRHYVGGMLQSEFKYDNLKILMRIFDLIGLYNSKHNSLHAQPMCTTLHCSNIVYLQHGGGE